MNMHNIHPLPLYAIFVIATLACQTTHAQPILNESDMAGFSRNTRAILERYETCLHFAGEWSGEPDLDKYIHRRVKELRCDRIDHDVSQLRRRSLNQPRVIKALSKIEHEYDVSR